MTNEERAALRALAEKALSKGPIASMYMWEACWAAANPTAVLALLDENARCEAVVREAIEFAEQDTGALTTPGREMLARWQAVLSEPGA